MVRQRGVKNLIPPKKVSGIRIETKPEELFDGGLFGQPILWSFEILPFLFSRGIFPEWRIRSALYGRASDGLVIPGVLDLAYEIGPGPKKEVGLIGLRNIHRHALGNDWSGLSALWNAYFRVPDRIENEANRIGSLSDTIGIHYRGNDKQIAFWDSNPVSHQDFLAIIRQFCIERPHLQRIFLATDDPKFYTFLRENISLDVTYFGGVGFHKDELSSELKEAKADRAMLDCVLLSRCSLVLLTSSALSSFAKVLNPQLEIYRVAASKLFDRNAPYFPAAYIPVYASAAPEISAIVDRLMIGDWTQSAGGARFKAPFTSRQCWPTVPRWIYVNAQRLPGCGWVRKVGPFLEAFR